MAYTSEELVQRHLATGAPVVAAITDQPLVAGTGNAVTFYSGAVDDTSVVVKSPAGASLQRVGLTLQTGANQIAAAPLVPGSVVAASDSSLGEIYTENTDYVIDYRHGLLYVKSGGDLAAGASIVVWFRPYLVYAAGVDYTVTAASGELRRLAGGEIDPNETVYIDYAPLYTSVDEVLVQAAVLEANDLIGKEVDPGSQFGADPVLQAAATNSALAIVCRSLAARALISSPGDDRAATAWMKLGEQYGAISERLIKAFRPPFDNPAPPRIR